MAPGSNADINAYFGGTQANNAQSGSPVENAKPSSRKAVMVDDLTEDDKILRTQLTLMGPPMLMFFAVYLWSGRTGGHMRFSFLFTLFAQLVFAQWWSGTRFKTHIVNGAMISAMLWFPYLAIRPQDE